MRSRLHLIACGHCHVIVNLDDSELIARAHVDVQATDDSKEELERRNIWVDIPDLPPELAMFPWPPPTDSTCKNYRDALSLLYRHFGTRLVYIAHAVKSMIVEYPPRRPIIFSQFPSFLFALNQALKVLDVPAKLMRAKAQLAGAHAGGHAPASSSSSSSSAPVAAASSASSSSASTSLKDVDGDNGDSDGDGDGDDDDDSEGDGEDKDNNDDDDDTDDDDDDGDGGDGKEEHKESKKSDWCIRVDQLSKIKMVQKRKRRRPVYIKKKKSATNTRLKRLKIDADVDVASSRASASRVRVSASSSAVHALLLPYSIGAEGHDLSSYDTVVHCEPLPESDLGVHRQAQYRAHRLGQIRATRSYMFIMSETDESDRAAALASGATGELRLLPLADRGGHGIGDAGCNSSGDGSGARDDDDPGMEGSDDEVSGDRIANGSGESGAIGIVTSTVARAVAAGTGAGADSKNPIPLPPSMHSLVLSSPLSVTNHITALTFVLIHSLVHSLVHPHAAQVVVPTSASNPMAAAAAAAAAATATRTPTPTTTTTTPTTTAMAMSASGGSSSGRNGIGSDPAAEVALAKILELAGCRDRLPDFIRQVCSVALILSLPPSPPTSLKLTAISTSAWNSSHAP